MGKNNEKRTSDEDWWRKYAQQMHVEKTLALHFGYYEKGIRSHEEAVINKNKLIEKLLDLNILAKKKGIILDAGCGVGGTLIYFVKKYSNMNFIGVNNSPVQIRLAPKFAQQNKVSSNTEFILDDCLSIAINDNSIDGIFVLEAFNRMKNNKRFLQEASRILKQNKKLVIEDAFLQKKPSNYFSKLAYDVHCKTWKLNSIKSIDDFKTYLKDSNFENIKIKDITKNSWLSYFIINLKFLSYAIFSRSKKKAVYPKDKISKKKPSFSKYVSIYILIMYFSSIFLFLNRTIRMMAITAVKKK